MAALIAHGISEFCRGFHISPVAPLPGQVLLSRQVWGWGQVTGTSGYTALGHQKGRILQELNGRSGKLNMSLAANGDEGVLRG